MKRSRTALVVFWASLAVIVAMVLYLGATQWQSVDDATVESVGSRPAYTPSASASAAPSASPSSSGSTSPSAGPSGSSSSGSSSSGSSSPSDSGSVENPVMVSAPMRLRIPALDVDTKVFAVGLDKNRAIEIPEDIRYVGWYELGVPPGVDRGSAVIVGHRDGRVQGRGVFYFLGTLNVGDKVYVKTSEGEELPYKVVSRESILKKRLPYEELFAVDGKPRLTLISCGGYYDRNNGGYQDNVVVTAVPMFEPIPTVPTASATPSASATESVPAASPAATTAEGPVSVTAPEAATVLETSEPILLGGS